MIPFTVQPTNFQHVQICPLCNHADDLATSGRRLHQSLGAEWSWVFFLFRLINVKNKNAWLRLIPSYEVSVISRCIDYMSNLNRPCMYLKM